MNVHLYLVRKQNLFMLLNFSSFFGHCVSLVFQVVNVTPREFVIVELG